MNDELNEIVARHDESLKSLHKRVDGIEELAHSVNVIATEIKHMRENQEQMKSDIDEMKKRPSALWDKLVGGLIGAVATGLVGAALALILK